MRAARVGVAIVLALSAATLLVVGTRRLVETQRTTALVNRMREDLYRARATADRCRSSLVTSESSLLALTATIDSMRARVDSFEALGDGQVPGERYEEYLAVFDSYNDSVSSWEARSERLRTAEASCRAVIEGHNLLSDSIQRVLQDAGIADP